MLAQIGLAVTSLTAITFMAIGRPPYLWLGCLVGLVSQGFWFWTATHPWQPGLFVVAIAYTVIYVLGSISHRPRRRQ